METKKKTEDKDKKKDSKQRIEFRYNMIKYWEVLKRYKWAIIVLLFLIAIEESLKILEKFFFKAIVDNGTTFVAGDLLLGDFSRILIIIAFAFIGAYFLKAFIGWTSEGFLQRTETSAIFDLKTKYFNHIILLSHSFFTTHKTGSLISRLTRGASSMERMSDVFVFNALPLIFQFILTFAAIVYLDFISAMIVVITVFAFVGWSVIIQRRQESSNIEANQAEDIEKGNIADIFTNVDSIKYFGKEDYIKKRFAKLAEITRLAFLKNWSYYKLLSLGQTVIIGLGIFFMMFFSLRKLVAGEISIGSLVFIYTTFISLTGPLFGFVHGIRNFYRSMADFQELFAYGKITPEVKDKNDARECKIKKGNVEFDNMSFNYGNRKIFDKFSLDVKENQKVALVGHSGSGKTTLVKLLYRLYDVKEGSIKIDGEDIRNFGQESLRSEMAIVPQECILFDDTVYNNILFSNPKASREEVLRAIRFAQLDKIIEKFPNKENTIVGERGVKLSGGEKQRVSIARALLANKRILVLDEATASLDSETEYEIQEALKQLMKGRTTIVIAHRLSTIMSADKIVVMKDGKIVQSGKHARLISELGEYKKLWNLQKGGYLKE